MSFRGTPRGGRGGGFGGGGFRGGRGGYNSGPPDSVVEAGAFMHPVEGDMFFVLKNPKIPMFNSTVYFENKSAVGKIDEILGPIHTPYFTVKPGEGIVATSFKPGDKVYIGPDRLLPLEK